MHCSTTLSLLLIILAATTCSTAAATTLQKRDGCYPEGMRYTDLSDKPDAFKYNARWRACNYITFGHGDFLQFETKEYTHYNPNNDGTCVKFSVKNTVFDIKTLDFDECMSVFAVEMNACPRGSYQWHGDFYYYNDPQSAEFC